MDGGLVELELLPSLWIYPAVYCHASKLGIPTSLSLSLSPSTNVYILLAFMDADNAVKVRLQDNPWFIVDRFIVHFVSILVWCCVECLLSSSCDTAVILIEREVNYTLCFFTLTTVILLWGNSRWNVVTRVQITLFCEYYKNRCRLKPNYPSVV